MKTELTMEEIHADPYEAFLLMLNDPAIFVGMSLLDKKKTRQAMKRIKPHSEDTYDHGWLLELMKEDIEANEGEETEAVVEKLASAAESRSDLGITSDAILGVDDNLGLTPEQEVMAQEATEKALAVGSLKPQLLVLVEYLNDQIAGIEAIPNRNNYQSGRRVAFKQLRDFISPPIEG